MTITQEQLDQANAEKTLAEAAKAKAEATKAKAEADKATADAAKAQREEQEAASDAGAQQRDAASRRAIAEADKVEFEAQQAKATAFIPDLSKADIPPLGVSGDQPLFASLLSQRSLARAADNLAADVTESLPRKGESTVLLTLGDDLASLDGVYVEVDAGLTMLSSAAKTLIEQSGNDEAIAGAVVAAVVSALPAALAFFSPTRTLSSHAATLDGPIVLAAVAGALVKDHDVVLADFRTVPLDGVVMRDGELFSQRSQLKEVETTVKEEKASAESDRVRKQAALEAVTKEHQSAPAGTKDPRELDAATAARDRAVETVTKLGVQAALVEDLVKAIDDYRKSIHTTPSGATRSPLVTAALYEGLHAVEKEERFGAALLIKSGGATLNQLIDDRKLGKDRFDLIGSASVGYTVIEPATSLVTASGVAVGTGRIRGTIGSQITVTDAT